MVDESIADPAPEHTDNGDHVPVLITGMNGDAGVKSSKFITQLLSAVPAVKVTRSKERVDIDYGKSISVLNAIEATVDLLVEQDAEAGICGAAPEDGSAIALWFVGRGEPPDHAPGVFTSDDVLLAEVDFPQNIQLAIAGSTVAAASTSSPATAQKLAPVLKYYADTLSPLIKADLLDIPMSHQPGFLTAVGNVVATRARQTRNIELYASAAEAYRRAATGYDPEFAPLCWAGAKTHLVFVLQAMAALDQSFEDAAKAGAPDGAIANALLVLTEIRETLSAENAPRAWAQAQIDFAMLTYRRAVLEGKDRPFREALQSLQTAQSVFTRQTMPRKWADIMNHMGVILMTMGENRGDDGVLKHAITSFEQAHQVRRRETMPTLWAQTSNNLGAASFALAKRTHDKEAMTDAARNFEGAMEVYEEHGQTQRAHVIEKNLARVRRLMETS